MAERLTLGIDVGTSAVKLALVGDKGIPEIRSFHSQRSLAEDPSRDLSPRFLTDWIWEQVEKQVSAWPECRRVTDVAVTAHGQSGILVQDRRSVGQMIPWWFPVSKKILDEQANILNDLYASNRLDCVIHPRGAWLPSRLKQVASQVDHSQLREGEYKAVQLKDLLNMQLCGEVFSDARSLRGLLDNKDEIPNELGDWIGLGDILPNIAAPEYVPATIDDEGSKISGLPVGTRVRVGCDDFSAALLGFDAKDRTLLNLASTSEHIAVQNASASSRELRRMRGQARITGLTYLPACGEHLPPVLYTSTNSGGRTLLSALPELPDAPLVVRGADYRRLLMVWLDDIMGDEPESKEMKGVPDFDAEIDGRRGLNPDPSHRGGWVKDPNLAEIGPRLQAWRIFDAMVDTLEPAKTAMSGFVSKGSEIQMAGGLAYIPQVVTRRANRWNRGVKIVAGSEIGAVGITKLARGSKK